MSEKLMPPKWDTWICRMPNPNDQRKAITLFKRSGAPTKSDFMRTQILNENFRVIKTDLGSMRFYQELSQLVAAINKIGVLFNQTVKSINQFHTEKVAVRLLNNVAKNQLEIVETLKKVIDLVEEMKNDSQCNDSEKPDGEAGV